MKKKIFIITCLAVMISMVLGPMQTVMAETPKWPSPGLNNKENVYPIPGAGTFTSINGVFDKIEGSNSAPINVNNDTVALELNADKDAQVGAMWSKKPIVDLTNNFTLDLQVYFGNKILNGADGLAFALTGTRPTNAGINGASLGVWGGADGSSAATIAAQGLQNSFVVVVDTHKSENDPDALYPNLLENHQYVGSGYPGKTEMYGIQNNKSKLKFGATLMPPSYVNQIKNNISNDKWHRLSISWQAYPEGGGALTYSFSNTSSTPAQTITQTVKWTETEMDSIFGQKVRQVYLGFTSATSPKGLIESFTEPHLITIKSLADFNQIKGAVTLQRGTEPVVEGTLLNIGDKLTYRYVIDVTNLEGSEWPVNQIVLPKGKYFDYLKADGKPAVAGDKLPVSIRVNGQTVPAEATVQSDGNSAVLTDLGTLPKRADSKLEFSLPAVVKPHTLTSNLQITNDATGSINGGATTAKTYTFVNAADQKGGKFIKYVLAGDPGTVTLKSVPSFVFEKYNAAINKNEDPVVADFIQGLLGQSPFPQTTPQIVYKNWLNAFNSTDPSSGATGGVLEIADTRPNKPGWHLQMSMTPFSLADGSYVLGDNGSNDGGKTEMTLVSFDENDPDLMHKIASVKDDNNVVTVKKMSAGGSDWSIGDSARYASALMTVQKTPSVRTGQYRSTITWTLSDAPMP
ncbi:hypothetical protein LRK_12680 [Lacticaseibacillus rhamnosus K32]|uniref:L-type lectin-domain containing protein n=1 Tax=Lacticaseibacillus rhamnosus TaxID=47715 RepID=UPI0004E2C835|nr:L-type lectin-domain containing protein [Lacticaseibacillus rhamnosus]KFC33910.1 hypothetical protein LRK_12680 [Lacticaseibacillus rhamnosus K32]KMO49166.1 hypothetical protein PY97_06595 [Lacticaseibacillus rhamnosus]MCT3172013.1 hypothetical protein [Lacticaseibacillus rhamnosus]MCT3181675.1 hypothetical protein [Lacticaseibacillus rhamnosus]OAU24489.1 hypothetical protein PY91_04275 [Lacticaseibacillus rhamnosus]